MIYLNRERKTYRVATPSTEACTFFDRSDLLAMRAARQDRYWIHGDFITVFAGAADTHGSYCFFETRILSPGLSCVRPHAHVLQDETTCVRSGRFEFIMAGKLLLPRPAVEVDVPPGTVPPYQAVRASPRPPR